MAKKGRPKKINNELVRKRANEYFIKQKVKEITKAIIYTILYSIIPAITIILCLMYVPPGELGISGIFFVAFLLGILGDFLATGLYMIIRNWIDNNLKKAYEQAEKDFGINKYRSCWDTGFKIRKIYKK